MGGNASAIDGGRAFNWGRASGLYAQYRDIYPEPFYQDLLSRGLCTGGQRVLDVGTGTGVLPRRLAHHGACFTGADPSENQIIEARRLTAEAGLDIDYQVAGAEDLGLPAGSFDVVTACQCHIYFDNARAMPELHRVLDAGGRLCILWVAWLPEDDRRAAASEELVLKYNPEWTGAGFRRTLLTPPQEAKGLFDVTACEGYDLSIPFTRESWHGRMMACRGIGASSLSGAAVAAFAQAHRAMLEKGPERFEVHHHVSVLILQKR